MIFLSHNYKDKDIVEPIALKLKEIYGQENIFYDSWSIKPGENIIGKMNEGITKCKWFFFFISKNSLNSNMVDLEWQSALYKATKDGIKFIPVKIDDCYPPQILISTLYIDMYNHGFDNALRDIFDIIDETDSNEYKKEFENLKCTIKRNDIYELNITIDALKLIEPNPAFAFAFSNPIDDISYELKSDIVSINSDGTLDNGKNFVLCRINRVLTKGFPYEITLKSKSGFKMGDLLILQQISKNNYKYLTNIIETC
ncbi:MAG: toll/interleukin-1 receptor domain-containing protein [Bacilli bacterium]|nr:toll/interleukin-1 receptor domain-containing protein [Bacilli bacterium]